MEQISSPEDRPIEITLKKGEKEEKGVNKSEQTNEDVWDSISLLYMYVQFQKEKRRSAEEIFKGIMAQIV